MALFRAAAHLAVLAALVAALSGSLIGQPAAPARRVVAIGDIHGAIGGLTRILRAAGLIDANDRWSGGTAHLVQTGDFTDRGESVRTVIDFLMRLEDEARRAGGRVDVLFGNHEGMNVLRDLRDVSPKAYAAFADDRSDDRRRRAYDAYLSIAKGRGNGAPAGQSLWMAAHPRGFVEYVQAMGPGGRYGRWIRDRRAMLRVDDTIFMHAGVPPTFAGSIDEVNRAVERDVRTWDTIVGSLERARLITPAFTLTEIVSAAQVEIGRIAIAQKTGVFPGEHVTRELVDSLQQLSGLEKWTLVAADGPLWYRGFATVPDTAQADLDALLRRLDARRFVTGHTPQLPGRITARLGGRLVLIDTGMLTEYFSNGQPSALEISGGRLTAIYPTGREEISAAGVSGAARAPVASAMNAH
jgi:hypothetical protein